MSETLFKKLIPLLIFMSIFGGGIILPYENIYSAECIETGSIRDGTRTHSCCPDGSRVPYGQQCPGERGLIETVVGAPGRWAAGLAGDALLKSLGWLSIIILSLVSWLTGIAGLILNQVIYQTIVTMAEKIGPGGPADQAWKVVRDVSNMAFIFVLLYAGIRMILGTDVGVQRLIKNVIVVALLMNFSLFFTKVVIDASNVLAIFFYGAMAPGALDPNASVLNAGLSNTLMHGLKLQTIWDASKGAGLEGATLLVIGVMGSILGLIAAFVFFAISIMLVVRFVVLIFVMVLSPLAFIATILPNLKSYTDKWVAALVHQSFFAPLYFLLTWIVIKITQSLGDYITTGSWTDLVTEVAGNATNKVVETGNAEVNSINLLIMFMIIIAMLIASLVMSKQFADKAGSLASSAMGWATGAAGTAVLGGAGWAGRRSIGAWGTKASSNEDLKRRAAEGSVRARLQLAAAKKASSSSFDARNAPGFGQLSKTAGVNLGKAGGKGGYEKVLKDRQEAYKKRYGALKPSDGAKKAAEEDVKKAKQALDNETKAAIKAFDAANPKSEEHLSAERKLKELRSDSLAGMRPEYESELRAAEENLAAEEEKRTRRQVEFVIPRTQSQTEAHKQASEKQREINNRMENLAKRMEAGYLGGRLPIFRGKEKAKVIRGISKEETDEQKLEKLAAKVAKEKADKEAKENKEKQPSGESEKPKEDKKE